MGKKADRLDEAMTAVSDEENATNEGGKRTTTDRQESIATFYLSPEIRSYLRRYAKDWQQSESAVARYVLRLGIEEVKKGRLPPMETIERAILE